jgi:SPP1 gp7 family putative phage head morphogenesis protein
VLGQRAELNVLYGLTKVPQWCAMCGDYHAADFPPSGGLRGALPKIQIDKWLSLFSKKMTNVASYIFRKGGYNSTMLNDKPIKDLREELYGFFEEGLQSGLSVESNVIPPAMAKSLKENLFIFSACKTETELRTLGDLLRNPDGTIKPRAQFMREATELYKTYNQNYLEAEYNYAVASSQMAAKWSKFAEAGDRFDLQYRTASDDHVRESHVKLHNVTLPFSDDFWNDFFPPNGWRCRCVVVQVRKGKHPLSDSKKAIADGKAATTLTNKDGVNKLAIFRYNPGKQAVIFPPHHPYMQALDSKQKLEIAKQMPDAAPDKREKLKEAYAKIYELDRANQFNTIKEYDNGGKVMQHIITKEDKNDYKYLLDIADIYAKEGNIVEILPEIAHSETAARDKIMPGAPEGKNPDLRINGKLWEVKTPKTPYTEDSIRNIIAKGTEQSDTIIVNLLEDISANKKHEIINNLMYSSRSKVKDKLHTIVFRYQNQLYTHIRTS